MSEVKVNKISPRTNCGTVQLGDSGDTITIPAGATITNNGTQTGFGRTGTVDWQTGSIKTASFTAVSGEGYFVNTTSAAVTVTLPASPSGGAIVSVKDYAQTFATNNCTIARNSSNIEGVASDVTLDGNAESVTFVYVDSTKGWVLVNEATTIYGQQFVAATGGSVATCGNFKIHTFTGPGTFCVSNAGNPAGSNTVDYLVIAGGGGGAAQNGGGAGGGAGGFRESSGAASGCYTASPLGSCVSALPVTATGYPITVGGGGSGAVGGGANATNGSNSIFSSITSTGGGSGGPAASPAGLPGGSGGGGSHGNGAGGSGNTPPVTPPQGKDGGNGSGNTGGGGGGAGTAGADASPCAPVGGAGGNGVATSISGSSVTRAGGGGGNAENQTGGPGGTGGGGAGAPTGADGGDGTANTGGGGGGIDSAPSGFTAGDGGSGIVIIRYRFQ